MVRTARYSLKLFFIQALIVTNVFAQPIDKKATMETNNLYKNLVSLSHKGILFGHQDDLAYGTSWEYEAGRSDVKSVCGDYPALYGWELGGIELDAQISLDSVPFSKIRQFIIDVYKRGGINAVSWHLRSPVTGGTAWDVSSKVAVKNILPGGPMHPEFIKYLERLARFIESLKTNEGLPIPIIFRPWHENTGSWFWWGKDLCTAGEYKALWKFTVDYLRNNKKLHNILYAYSPAAPLLNGSAFMERYPGNALVDIVGVDIYQGNSEASTLFGDRLKNELTLLCAIARDNHKLCALTEIGFEQIPDASWWSETLLKNIRNFSFSYMLFWRNAHNRPNHYYVPYPGQKSAEDFLKLFNSEKVIFQNKLTTEKVYK